MKQIFAIIGGDARQISLAARLALTGAEVRTYGLPEESPQAGVLPFGDWREAIRGATAVLLPLPASPDGVRINLPLCPQLAAPTFADVLACVPTEIPLIGGKFSPAMRAQAEQQGRELLDFCKSEEFQLKNAVPSAEGAIAILMDRMPRTVDGMRVAVTGYGRIGKALVRMLLGLGAKVTVGARKQSALDEARALGCDTVHLNSEDSVILLAKGKQAIFNTVPHWLFTGKVLNGMNKRTLLIDLASAPGGVDAEVARGLGMPVIWALSLPGKYAPVTAGEIIADCVLSMLQEEGAV
jgi:dipicolinate synthase subunit A